ncbi:MAG: peptidoglycan editing factor PgeF [Chlorobi bacterium]|nr:peptidoglycan editing factor PgeF [Chlorobiota bacterium]
MRPEHIVPGIFSGAENLLALQTTRRGGVSPAPFESLNLGKATGDDAGNIASNTSALCNHVGIVPERLACSDQVHGTEVLHVRQPGFYPGYDAFVTSCPDIYLCVFTADCFPVLLHDAENQAIAAIHAGWRGTAGGIVIKTVEAMRRLFNSRPEDITAWIGTGISQAAYEVDASVAGNFPADHCIPSRAGGEKFLLDLAGVNKKQLVDTAVAQTRIECSSFCAFLDRDLFYSYRRDAGRTGRMASIIGITPGRKMQDRQQ